MCTIKPEFSCSKHVGSKLGFLLTILNKLTHPKIILSFSPCHPGGKTVLLAGVMPGF